MGTSVSSILLSGGPVWALVRLSTAVFVVLALIRLLPGPERQVPCYRVRPFRAAAKVSSYLAAASLVGCTTVTLAASHLGGEAAPHPLALQAASQGRTEPFTVGVFTPSEAQSWQGVQRFSRTAHQPVRQLLDFVGQGQPFPRAVADRAYQHGAELVLHLEPSGRAVDASWLREVANQIRAYGHPVILSWAPEANGRWYPWGWTHESPARYRASWDRVMRLFRSAPNVFWLDTLNVTYPKGGPIRDYLIPGVRVGLDGYYRKPGRTFDDVFGQTIRTVHRLTREPVMISETAIGPRTGQAAAMPGLIAGIKRYHLSGLIWFNANQDDGIGWGSHQDWRLRIRIP